MATSQLSSGGVKSEPDILKMGHRIAGYEVLSLLGRGGMGQVYQARQVSLDRVVALKILSPHLAKRDPSFAQRFIEEARAAGRLNHPNIVHVHDVGTAQVPGGPEIHYFSMEYIEGSSVQGLLDLQGRIDEGTIGKIMQGMAEAMVYAHKSRLVHRDIKPDNIMVTRDGAVKLADLGLAVRSTASEALGAAPGTKAKVMGTPLYLSPEQAQARPLDHRSDQYSLGATLFHMLTGEPPYRGGDSATIMAKHVREPIPDPKERSPDIADTWRAMAMKLMSKDSADRFAKPEDFKEAVTACTQGLMPPVLVEVLADRDGARARAKWGASAHAISGGLVGRGLSAKRGDLPPRWVPFAIAGTAGILLGLVLMPVIGVRKGSQSIGPGGVERANLIPFADALGAGRLADAEKALVDQPLGTPEVVEAQKSLDLAATGLIAYLKDRIVLARDKKEVDQLYGLAKDRLNDKGAAQVKALVDKIRPKLPDEAPPINVDRPAAQALEAYKKDLAEKLAPATAPRPPVSQPVAVPKPIPPTTTSVKPTPKPAVGPPMGPPGGPSGGPTIGPPPGIPKERPLGYPPNLPWPPPGAGGAPAK